MLLTNRLRKHFFQYPFLETAVLIALYLGIGYLVNPEDICLLDLKFSALTIVLAIITLFHGISSGLLAMFMIGAAMKIFYVEFPYEAFLRESILVLIFGEFHYYWNRSISQHQIENKFTRTKLEELGKAFYMLKVSHDQIEKSYVSKPMSLRNSIYFIKEGLQEDSFNEGYKNFLLLMQELVKIETAHLVRVPEGSQMELLATTQDEGRFEPSDLMVDRAMEKMAPVYVSGHGEHYGSEYLAVLPAVSEGRVIGLLAIEKMPFLAFNKDNLITVSILVSYFFDELCKIRTLPGMEEVCIGFQENFRFEVYRQYQFYQRYGVHSVVVIIKSYDKLRTHCLLQEVTKRLRLLEVLSHMKGEGVDVIGILFPFADEQTAQGFLNRLESLENVEKKVEYAIFSIAQRSLISAYSMEHIRCS